MSDKETVLELVKRLTPDVSIRSIIQEIEFILAVQEGLNEIDQGEGVSIESLEQMIESWTTV
ncbi:MAG: hypothetical protein HEQ13_06615 [Dolichospermum sp. DEX189]|jgi:hypothetical protein|uniref:Uncharacterized protein n=1 Tax=Aphanizomenon flos-aquae FACHB-1040 TaxID=2692887 RepID=A0ABR8BSK8_APHFL|nr:hypothetical protein [Aphanizomenon flos-aquae]MBD2277376.1 hypothetical protein [Aphanizomenon flos-aquae FACHB-1040]MBO1069059.1 hypothetical protein [Dolichospermum sp. DEX189]MBS9389427.1 hypothetical protein [Dolichospermum sp. WA123]